MSEKTLLVLGASLYQLPTIRIAMQLGYRVIAADNVPGNPGHAVADNSYDVSTRERASILEIARRERVSGVIAPCTDIAVPTLAYVAQELGLPAPPLASAEILCDKLLFRQFQLSRGLPVPRAMEVSVDFASLSGLFDSGPKILKPRRSSGSKGIVVIRSESELRVRLPETVAFDPDHRGILEEFYLGKQGTCEGFILDGVITQQFITDRMTAPLPYVATHGHLLPSTLEPQLQRRLLEQLADLLQALAISGGPFDCDFVATDDEVHLIEVTPRLGGNSLSELLTIAAGFDMVTASIRYACGDDPQLPTLSTIRPTAVVLLGLMQSGRINYDLREVNLLRRESWIRKLDLDFAPGQPVDSFVNGRNRVGEAILQGDSRQDLENRVSELHRRLSLRIK